MRIMGFELVRSVVKPGPSTRHFGWQTCQEPNAEFVQSVRGQSVEGFRGRSNESHGTRAHSPCRGARPVECQDVECGGCGANLRVVQPEYAGWRRIAPASSGLRQASVAEVTCCTRQWRGAFVRPAA